jgi:hypothetical protein
MHCKDLLVSGKSVLYDKACSCGMSIRRIIFIFFVKMHVFEE